MSIANPTPIDIGEELVQGGEGRSTLSKFIRHRAGMFGLLIISIVVACAVLAPWLAGHDPNAQALAANFQPPSVAHWLGTDEFGRDELARVLWGGRVTLIVSLLTVLAAAPIGTVLGMVAGYFGGAIDLIISRIIDLFLAFPSLVLALAFSAALGPGLEKAVIAVALTSWPHIARIARADTRVARRSEYVLAERMLGVSRARLLLSSILPVVLPAVLVRSAISVSAIILTAAGLGFLGLGAQPPTPEWGALLSGSRRFMVEYPWLVAAPGVAILLASVGFNLLGDAIRDVLDPRVQDDR